MDIPSKLRNECIKLYKDGASRTEVSLYITEELGVGKTQAHVRAKIIWDEEFDKEYESRSNVSNSEKTDREKSNFKVDGDDAVATVFSTNDNLDVKTLEGLLKVCKVDPEIWSVERYEVNKWATARRQETEDLTWKDGKKSGSRRDHGKMAVQPLYQVKAWLKRRNPFNSKAAFEKFIKSAADYAPRRMVMKREATGSIYELDIPDLHAAKLIWGEITGGKSYNLETSLKVYRNAVKDLVSRIDPDEVSTIVIPIGNDLFNTDTINYTTTAGTPQMDSSPWQRTFTEVSKMFFEILSDLSQTFRVEVVIVPGNHDLQKCFYLGSTLEAFFIHNPNVVVDNSPNTRKYKRYGNTLIGYTHGKNEKRDSLPMLMANEAEDWNNVTQRFFRIGHFHHEMTKELNGVMVCVSPSLCPVDEWHHGKGFIGTVLRAKGHLYSLDYGLVSENITYYNEEG